MITEVPTSLQGEPFGQQALPYRLVCDLAVRGAAHLPDLVAGSTSHCETTITTAAAAAAAAASVAAAAAAAAEAEAEEGLGLSQRYQAGSPP